MSLSEVPLPHLLLLILLVGLTPTSQTPDSPEGGEEKEDIFLPRLVVDNRTRHLYVSTQNSLYHMDADIETLDIKTVGPYLDNPKCSFLSYPCAYPRTLTDNDIKILELFHYQGRSMLLTCGTVYQGLCSLMDLNEMSEDRPLFYIGPTNSTVAFSSGRASAVAFFAPGFGGQHVLWSAVSEDGRPAQFSPPAVSSKVLYQENGEFRFKYAYDSEHFTGLYFDARYRRRYKVQYLWGSGYGNFAYFLTTQPVSPHSETLETRLVRICANDPAFHSYTELPLRCQRGSDVYNMATSAALGPAGTQLRRLLGVDLTDAADVLYVSFALTLDGGTQDKSKSSMMCSFPISSITEAFTKASRACLKGEPGTYLLEHITGIETPCKVEEGVEVGDDFCGSDQNPYIAARDALFGGLQTFLEDHVTSLAVTLQNGQTIVIAGTENGDLYKIHLENPDRRVLYVHNLGKGPIRSSNAFDSAHKYFYVCSSATKLKRFSISSCVIYTDCAACLGKGDPVGCGWCGDRCATLSECSTPDTYSTDACPPVIHGVAHFNGPTAGGAFMAIKGENFGSPHIDETQSSVFISVAGANCRIHYWNQTMLMCETSPVPSPRSGPIEVNVTDTSRTLGPFDLRGSVTSSVTFSYEVPELYGVHPGWGPLSGGTNVTLYGHKLNIGTTSNIWMAKVPCVQSGFLENAAWCITGNWSGLANKERIPTRGPVVVHIDDAILGIEAPPSDVRDFGVLLSRDFMYRPDPQVNQMHPQVATVSGSMNVTVSGEHLDSVARPEIVVRVASTPKGEELEFKQTCHVLQGGRSMVCRTPSLRRSSLHEPTERVPLVAHVAFNMDGVRELPKHRPGMSQLLYYPDPEFQPFTEARRLPQDETQLNIQGKYLSLTQTPSDVSVTVGGNPCNVTVIHMESLLCTLPGNLGDRQNTSTHLVEVHAGRLYHRLGYIEFEERHTSPKLIGIVIGVALFVCCALIFYIYWRRVHSTKRNLEYVADFTAEEQQPMRDSCGERRRQASNDYHNRRSVGRHQSIPAEDQVEGAKGNDFPVEDETVRLLESNNVLIQSQNLTLGEIVGMGHFGCVYKGVLQLPDKDEKVKVAVKTLRNSSSAVAQDVDAFLKESLMMKDFHHDNVLSLVGVCFEKGQPMVLTPYMKHGDVLSYIQDEENRPTVKDLLMFGVQIAEGMAYLSYIKFVHRDLAARNCMLDEDMTVKVADFGLSRDIYERDYYCSESMKTKIPVRWMALESLEKGTYTSQTDVWSYGVLLWELMTRGVCPYPDVDNWDIINYLKAGRRMPQPSSCPNLLYDVMLSCWKEDPADRPTFVQLVEIVQGIISILIRKALQQTTAVNDTYVG